MSAEHETEKTYTPGGNPVCPKCGLWYGPGLPHKCVSTPVVRTETADLVTWTMPREDARDLLRWLRHNRPLGMPDRTFTGLIDALSTPPKPRPSLCPACSEPLSADGACWSCDWGPTPEAVDAQALKRLLARWRQAAWPGGAR